MFEARRQRWLALHGNLRGAVWITLSAFLGACTAATLKALSQELHPFQVVFFRLFLGFFVIMPFVLRGGYASWRTGRPRLQLARVLTSVLGMVCWVFAVQSIPLANAVSLGFTKPLFQIFLSIVLLRELVGWRRGSATAVGFIGVLIILRPGGEDFVVESLWALGAAMLFAFTQTFVKMMASSERPETITLYFSLIGVPVMLPLALLVWQTPSPDQWLLLGLLAVLATAGQSAWIQGLRAGEVTAIGPFEYTQLLWAGALGYLLFSELPGAWSWAGAAVIVGSTLYMARREAQLARAQQAARRPASDEG